MNMDFFVINEETWQTFNSIYGCDYELNLHGNTLSNSFNLIYKGVIDKSDVVPTSP